MHEPTATSILLRLQVSGAIPPDAVVVAHKGRAEWVERGMLLRLAVHKGSHSELVWTLFVGDPVLGRPFHDGGILALLPLRREGGEGPWTWPTDEAQAAASVEALVEVLAEARAFVPTRRELCHLLLAEGDVRHGRLVADLHSARAERLVRAIAIAQASHDDEVLAAALDILDRSAAETPSDAPTSLRNQALFWADQWTWQSGRTISIPEAVPQRAAPVHQDLGDFWERLG